MPALSNSRSTLQRFLAVCLVATLLLCCGCEKETVPPKLTGDNVDVAIAKSVAAATSKIEERPDSALAWGRLGTIFLANGLVEEAETTLAHAAELDPTDARWPYLRGRILVTKNPTAAISSLDQAVAICGNTPNAPRLRLIELLIEQDKTELASAHLADFLDEVPNEPRAQIAKARLQFMRGNVQECYDALTAMLRNAEQKRNEQVTQAKQLLSMGQQQKAQQVHQQALHAFQVATEGNQVALTLLAEAAQRLNKTDEARGYSDRASKLEKPFWPDEFWNEVQERATGQQHMLSKVDVLFGTGRYQESHALLDEVNSNYPKSLFGRIYKGRALIRDAKTQPDREAALRLYDEALTHLQVAREVDSESVDALFRSGVASLEKGKLTQSEPLYDQATKYFVQATEIKPDFSMAYYNLAHCQVAKNDAKSAIESLESAIDIDPDYLPARLGLGDLYYKSGDLEKARTHLNAALELDATNKSVKALLQRIAKQTASQ